MARIVIPGGNGFIGTELCRVAVQNGHDVAAFGRTGRPDLTPARHPWVNDIEWRAADVFIPDAWRDLLDGADAVIHAIATIREAPEHNVTFNRVNGESALQVAQAAVDAGVDSFVFLSVRDKPPFVSERFLAAKRRAERELPAQYPALRTVVLHPNLVFGPRRPGSATIAGVLNQLPRGAACGYAADMGRPLPVEVVAAAAVQAAVTPTLEGTLSVDQIDTLGLTSGLIAPDERSDPTLTPLLAGLGGAALGGWLLKRWTS
jgi:nucleoside-diphosphate-sugar epimerase